MIVLAFLQNQWVNDAAYAEARNRELMERDPELYTDHTSRALFYVCQSGKRLRKAFGDDCSERIVWANASIRAGEKSTDCFKADYDHMRTLIDHFKPDVILAFGKVASDAMGLIACDAKVIVGPHPAARYPDILDRLRAMAATLEGYK